MRVRRVRGSRGRIDFLVRLAPGEPVRTTSEMASRTLAVLPGLASHRCHNDEGRTFAEELADTEVAHLLEHVALEILVQSGAPEPTDGETTWDFERDGKGAFVVSLQCEDDRVCRTAMRLAEKVVRHSVEGGPPPDVSAEVARLGRLRERRRV